MAQVVGSSVVLLLAAGCASIRAFPAPLLTGAPCSFDVNLKAMWLASEHALPALCESQGSIVDIASMAARNAYPLVGYKTTTAAAVAHHRKLGRPERAARRGRERDPAGPHEA